MSTFFIRRLEEIHGGGDDWVSDPFPIASSLQVDEKYLEAIYNIILVWINMGEYNVEHIYNPSSWMANDATFLIRDMGCTKLNHDEMINVLIELAPYEYTIDKLKKKFL